MTRLDMVAKRYEEIKEQYDPRQVWLDVKILLDEIHERDILIKDFREQIIELKTR